MYYWLTVFSPCTVNFSPREPLDQYPHSQNASWTFFREPSVQASPSPSRVSLVRAPFSLSPTTSKHLLRRLWKTRPSDPKFEELAARPQTFQVFSSCKSPSRAPVFSCAHYFQGPATQASARQTFRRRKNLSINIILSRLAGKVYSFFPALSWINNVQVLWDYQNRRGGLTKNSSQWLMGQSGWLQTGSPGFLPC